MKRSISLLLCFMALCMYNAIGQQRMVQGVPHPAPLSGKSANDKISLRSDPNFTFDDIEFWVGEGINRAAMVIEWHDGKSPDAIVWGYKWNGQASGHDMIMAIARADPRILFLTQMTGPMGYTIDGIGYSEQQINLTYDLEGASKNPRISFKYNQPNEMMGQTKVPANPAADASAAIKEGHRTGVIDHPFNYTVYGYPAYDYDHWKSASPNAHWSAGWYEGYWSYFVKDNINDNFMYSGLGATSRKLTDGSWDAWSYNADMTTMEGTAPGDKFIAATIPSYHVRSVYLNYGQLSLSPGEAAKLTAYVCRDNATNKNVSWQSSNTSVVTVDPQGNVKAVSKGTAVITVKTEDRGHIASCAVTVDDSSVKGVTLNQSALRLEKEKTATLTATVSPSHATNKEVTWTSSDTEVASVTSGVVTAKKAGSATITVTTKEGGFTASCQVTVFETVVPDVTVDGTSVKITMPRVTDATSYEIYLFKPVNGKNELIGVYVADKEGNLIKRSGTYSTSSTITFSLDELDEKTDYRLQIRAMKGFDIIDTYYTETFFTAVSNENIEGAIPKVYYSGNSLYFDHCEGFSFSMANIKGQKINLFDIKANQEQYTIRMANGIYILYGENGPQKITFKIAVHN